MIVLQASRLDKSYGQQQVFSGITLVINQHERVGIVGPNGSGKTTLLKCLTGELEPDRGEISLPGSVKMGYLAQLPEQSPYSTAWDAIMDSFSTILEQRSRLRQLELEMSQPGVDLEAIMEQYSRVTEAYEQADGYACETMARRILAGLGFSPEQFAQPWQSFSGGEKTRLNLGRLLARNPDLLLLDEPTNHLDLETVEWLEGFLSSYPGTLLVVSHDRRFLDRVATRILDLRGGALKSYPGNYTRYLELRAEQDLAARRAYEKQQEQIRRTEEYIRRFGAGIKAKQARGRQSQLERLQRLERVPEQRTIGVTPLVSDYTSGEEVLEVNELAMRFGENQVFSRVNFRLGRGDRAALVGPNGAGKTTLLRIITGDLTADEGEVRVGSRVRIAYLSQHNEELDPESTVLEAMLKNTTFTPEQARTRLGGMLFTGDDVFKRVGDLSGGERMRLALLKALTAGANFLILDEPTNHLDIDSREIVEEMLDEYPGTLLLVSHDRYLLDRVAETILELKEGTLTLYPGNYSYYREKMEERKNQAAAALSFKAGTSRQDQQRQRQKEEQRRQRRLQEQLATAEARLTELEQRKRDLEAALADPQTYADDVLARNLAGEYREIGEMVETAYEEWASLLEEIEK